VFLPICGGKGGSICKREKISLTKSEYEICEYLARNSGQLILENSSETKGGQVTIKIPY
jgi:glutamate dehydrogenase/leucine dehydrogenase